MLKGIYFTEENPMVVLNSALQKGQEAKKKKQVSNVQNEEVQPQRKNGSKESNQVPRKVTVIPPSRPTQHVEIDANEVVTPASKSKKQYRQRNMVESVSIPVEGIVDLEATPSRQKKRKSVVTESNVIAQYESEYSGGSREIITPGADLEDGIVKSSQNVIRDRLRRDKLVNNGHTYELNVNQLYRPTEGQDQYRIRKTHHLHIYNLKALMRHNPYAHVIDYLVLVDPKDVPSRDEFDSTRCFHYKYYVLGGNHSAEARRELMQEYPNNPIFETVKCIIYAGLTDVEAKLLAWDHNTDSEYRMTMTFIQRVRFIHSEFMQICGGEKSKVDQSFRKQCCLEIGIPIKEEKVKQKNCKGSEAFRAVDNIFQLAFKVGKTWDLIDDIFSLWENIGIKNQKVKKGKVVPWSGGKTGPDVKNLPEDMTITPWRTMQGVKDETLIATILSRVKSGELSMEEMCNEFEK